MSREIKFRAWEKKRKIMIPFEPLFLSDTGGFRTPENYRLEASIDESEVIIETGGYIHDDFAQGMNDDEYVLMQFTGLLDKNGKEIYEGDILQGLKSFNDNGIIVIDKKMFGGILQMDEEQDKTVEIIGNIYENSELLK